MKTITMRTENTETPKIRRPTSQVNIRMDSELKEILEQKAIEEDRSLTKTIQRMLISALNAEGYKPGIHPGLAI